MAGLHVVVVSLLLALVGCNKSQFSSSSGKTEREVKQTSDAKPTEEDKPKFKPTEEDDEPSDVLPATTTPAADGAVTKGSFTAWAVPAKPKPGESYWIHIEVQLPSDVQNYTQNDLSGFVIGTDMYERGIGRDSQGAGGFGGPSLGQDHPDQFQFLGTKATVAVWVPGAQYLVRDTVKIRSDLLQEEQSIEIVFQ
jgi:hypothetical protein